MSASIWCTKENDTVVEKIVGAPVIFSPEIYPTDEEIENDSKAEKEEHGNYAIIGGDLYKRVKHSISRIEYVLINQMNISPNDQVLFHRFYILVLSYKNQQIKIYDRNGDLIEVKKSKEKVLFVERLGCFELLFTTETSFLLLQHYMLR